MKTGKQLFTPHILPISSVPGPVSRLTYNGISNMSVNISWSEPDEPNGDIVGYSVRYGEFEGNADSESLVESLHLTINGLSECAWILYSFSYVRVSTISPISSFPVRYIPYKATVSARTSVGEGEPSSVVFFTLEGGEDSWNSINFYNLSDP